jgi:hypothetical protein
MRPEASSVCGLKLMVNPCLSGVCLYWTRTPVVVRPPWTVTDVRTHFNISLHAKPQSGLMLTIISPQGDTLFWTDSRNGRTGVATTSMFRDCACTHMHTHTTSHRNGTLDSVLLLSGWKKIIQTHPLSSLLLELKTSHLKRELRRNEFWQLNVIGHYRGYLSLDSTKES